MIVTTAQKLKTDLGCLTLDTCPVCKAKMELIFEDCTTVVDTIRIHVQELPQLKCTSCGQMVLTDRSKMVLMWAYEECKKHAKSCVNITPKSNCKSYTFCSGYNFIYDHRDYENIPGLDMNGDGFLTPVFFNKEALIYFMHHPDYELNLGSETYGTLDYKKENIISFGINTNGKVVMWLGDLDSMDDTTLRLLQVHNVTSDHTLMASEFYDAQLNAQWSEPIAEAEIVNLRNRFYELQMSKNSLDLYRLDGEVVDVIQGIKKPVMYTEAEIKPVIISLQKILVEAVNVSELKTFYRTQTGKEPLQNWGSIKYIEFLLSQRSQKDVRNLMSAIYVLNDLRILFSHLVSTKKQEQIKQNAIDAFGLSDFELVHVYRILLIRLKALYEELVRIS